MDQLPKIIMRCPKCSKEFPSDAVYCEACSAMLDPQEVTETTSHSNNSTDESCREDKDPSSKEEQMEDVRINTLKTEIEGKFVLTLRRELVQLKARSSRKESEVSDLQARRNQMEDSDYLSAMGKRKKEIEEIAARTAKLESILGNLRKKIEADISELGRQIGELETPGAFWFFDRKGRYYKILTAELKNKSAILDVISAKKSLSYFSRIRFAKIASALISLVFIIFLISWYMFNYPEAGSSGTQSSHGQIQAGHIISEKDVADVLEDIRQANMNKDLGRWTARYSRHYLESSGKKKDLLEQWKSVDLKKLNYRVADFNSGEGKASASISWDMELFAKGSKKIRKVSQTIRADFIIEDGMVKISLVRK